MTNWYRIKKIKKNISKISDKEINDIKSYKAFLLREVNCNKINDLVNFSKKFGKVFKYGKKCHISFKEISIENEMHYDGISARHKKNIPNYLFFYVENLSKINTKMKNKGEFKLLNSSKCIKDIPQKLLNILKTKKLEFYGCPTFYKPNVKKDEFSFKKKIIKKINGKLNLRTHIVSDLSAKVTKDNQYVESVEGWKVKITQYTGEQTLKLFRQLSKKIFNKKNLWKIKFKKKDLLIVDNRYVFHGRNSVSIPSKRLIHRIQVI